MYNNSVNIKDRFNMLEKVGPSRYKSGLCDQDFFRSLDFPLFNRHPGANEFVSPSDYLEHKPIQKRRRIFQSSWVFDSHPRAIPRTITIKAVGPAFGRLVAVEHSHVDKHQEVCLATVRRLTLNPERATATFSDLASSPSRDDVASPESRNRAVCNLYHE